MLISRHSHLPWLPQRSTPFFQQVTVFASTGCTRHALLCSALSSFSAMKEASAEVKTSWVGLFWSSGVKGQRVSKPLSLSTPASISVGLSDFLYIPNSIPWFRTSCSSSVSVATVGKFYIETNQRASEPSTDLLSLVGQQLLAYTTCSYPKGHGRGKTSNSSKQSQTSFH